MQGAYQTVRSHCGLQAVHIPSLSTSVYKVMKYVNFSENFQVKMTSIPPPPCETIPLGVNNVLYEQLTVGILRDRELEFVTIQKLWLPLKPRINEFRW
jgi:hypothetical protein